jgi:hypothetical protein
MLSTGLKAQENGEKEKVEGVLNELIQAYNTFNNEKLEKLLTNDTFSKTVQEGIIYSPGELLNIVAQEDANRKYLIVNELENSTIRIVDNKSAVALCEILVKTSPNDQKPFQTRTVINIVLEKVKGKWLIVTMHASGKRNNKNF